MLVDIQPNCSRWYDLEELPNETWEDVKDFEGLYKVSNYGRIKTLNYNRMGLEKIMKFFTDNYGYFQIKFSKNGKYYHKKVHRLVAEVFIPNPKNKAEVNHINPVTTEFCDNRVTNLEWVTREENARHTVVCGNMFKPTLGKFGKKHHMSKPIVQLDLKKDLIKEWENARDIQRNLGIDFRYVSRNCHHRCLTCHGFIFMFKEEYENEKHLGNFK